LTAPSGANHTAALVVPSGRTNCLTFARQLVLTEPGQYLVALSGVLNGTTIDVTGVNAGGVVIDRAELTFPATVASDAELQDRIAALESKVATLEAGGSGDGEKGAPAPAAALTLVLLAVLAAARRLR
jgi:hypothetical protein